MRTFFIAVFIFMGSIILSGCTSETLPPPRHAAESLPLPKLETPEYFEAQSKLLENLLPEYHVPTLRVWHRMIDFVLKSGGEECTPKDVRYEFTPDTTGLYSHLKRDDKDVYSFNLGSAFGVGTGGGEMRLFQISGKHIVGINPDLWADIGCSCCYWHNFPQFDEELLADIGKFKKMQMGFTIAYTTVDPKGIAKLKDIEHLALALEEVELNEETFRSLGQLENLESLRLFDRCAPGRKDFYRANVPLFDASHIIQFAPLQNLRVLNIVSCASTLQTFPRLAGLEDLSLEVAEVSNEALEQIKALPNLKKAKVRRYKEEDVLFQKLEE